MNQDDRRNPYVILGLRFGASEKEARSGFSKAKRKLRNEPEPAFTEEDLTWALHQIEQIISNPELALDVYRIPAMEMPDPVGIFNPAPHRLPRTTEPASAAEWDELRRAGLAAALKDVLSEALPEQSDLIPYKPGEE